MRTIVKIDLEGAGRPPKPPKNHLIGYFELFRKPAQSRWKLPRWWQIRLRMYSPDAQDSKQFRVGHLPATLWGSAGPNSKISKPT